MRHLPFALALAISLSAPAIPAPKVLAEGRTPAFLSIKLLRSPCDGKRKGAQEVEAFHIQQGPLKGCWIKTMGVILVIWDDGDASLWGEDLFTPLSQPDT